MAIALVLVSAALVVCLYLLLMGKKDAPVAVRSADPERVASTPSRHDERPPKSDSGELEKKRKELEELKKQFAEQKDELKTAKKKLFDQKEAGKADEDLVKARAEVERTASIQLESTRAELAQALEQVQKLKGEGGKQQRPARSEAPAAAPAPAAEVKAAPPPAQKVIRELSEADQEKMDSALSQAASARQRIADLEKAMKNSKGRADSATSQLKIARSETTLAKDKFRALERRVNRLMLERDLMARAITDLEKKTGITAERKELTADELAASDLKVNEKQAAEDKAEAEAQEKLLAADAIAPAVNEPVAAAPAAAAPAAVEPAAVSPVAEATPATPPAQA